MGSNEQFCNTLDKFPHADPVNAIWDWVSPWFGVWLCSFFTIFFASDFIYHAAVRKIEPEPDPDPIQQAPPLLPYPNPSQPATPANKVMAFVLATLSLLTNSFWFAQAIVNSLVKFYCVEDPHWEDWNNMWTNVGVVLGSPLFVAIIAWLKTVVNLILARWDRYLSDAKWHPFLGLHLILWVLVLPFIVIVLIFYSLAMLCMGRSSEDVKKNMQRTLQWMVSNIRRSQVQAFQASAGDERNTAEESGRMDEEQPLLEHSDSGRGSVPPYDGTISDPPQYTINDRD